ncbi:MAG: DUF5011 domain-containing protein, partial [Oscillospiraceae bacterium]|nr:DUF5011 domain-containing protein [Oscillospiraceae bacterium]
KTDDDQPNAQIYLNLSGVPNVPELLGYAGLTTAEIQKYPIGKTSATSPFTFASTAQVKETITFYTDPVTSGGTTKYYLPQNSTLNNSIGTHITLPTADPRIEVTTTSGTAPNLTYEGAAPTKLTYGVPPGSGQTQTLTVKNTTLTQDIPFANVTATLEGADAANFRISTVPNTSIAKGAQTTISIMPINALMPGTYSDIKVRIKTDAQIGTKPAVTIVPMADIVVTMSPQEVSKKTGTAADADVTADVAPSDTWSKSLSSVTLTATAKMSGDYITSFKYIVSTSTTAPATGWTTVSLPIKPNSVTSLHTFSPPDGIYYIYWILETNYTTEQNGQIASGTVKNYKLDKTSPIISDNDIYLGPPPKVLITPGSPTGVQDSAILIFTPSDPLANGAASGINNAYYIAVAKDAAAPAFDPANPAGGGWKTPAKSGGDFTATIDSTTFPAIITNGSAGAFDVYLVTGDIAGNYSAVTKVNSNFTYDTIPPTFDPPDPSNPGGNTQGDLPILHVWQNAAMPALVDASGDPVGVTAHDVGASGVKTQLPASSIKITGRTFNSTATPGAYTITYKATDAAGNEITGTRQVRVHALPALSASNASLNPLEGSANLLDDPRMAVTDPVKLASANKYYHADGTAYTTDSNLPDPVISIANAGTGISLGADGKTLNFGSAAIGATVDVTYTVTFNHPESATGLPQNSVRVTVKVTLTNSDGFTVTPGGIIEPGSNPGDQDKLLINYYQSNGVVSGSTNFSGVPTLSKGSPPKGNSIEEAFTLGNSVTPEYNFANAATGAAMTDADLAALCGTIGAYEIFCDIRNTTDNSHAYRTITLRVNSAMTKVAPVRNLIQGATGINLDDGLVEAYYTDYTNFKRNVIQPCSTSVNYASVQTIQLSYSTSYPFQSVGNTPVYSLLYIHGKPLVSPDPILLRTDAAAADLINHAKLTVTAEMAPTTPGGAVVPVPLANITVTRETSSSGSLATVGSFEQIYHASYTLPASYGATNFTVNSDDADAKNRGKVTVHGIPVISANSISVARTYANSGASFNPLLDPLINVSASVNYWDDVTSSVKNHSITNIGFAPNPMPWQDGSNPLKFTVDDSMALAAAGISGFSARGANRDITVTIGAIVGNAPVIAGAKDIRVIAGTNVDLFSGVSVTDKEDGALTPTIKLTRTAGNTGFNTSATNPADTSAPVTATIEYSAQDMHGNISKTTATLYVYGPLQIIGPADVNLRTKAENGVPDMKDIRASYVEADGSAVNFTYASMPAMFSPNLAKVDYSKHKNYNISVVIKHPGISSSSAASVTHTYALKIHERIVINGAEAIEKPDYRVNQAIDLLSGVNATYINSDGNLVTLDASSPKPLTVSPASPVSYPNPGIYNVKYSVPDDLNIPGEGSTTKEIKLKVHDYPAISAARSSVTVPVGFTIEEIEAMYNAQASIFYAESPKTKSLLKPEFDFSQVPDLETPGLYEGSVKSTDRFKLSAAPIKLALNIYSFEIDIDISDTTKPGKAPPSGGGGSDDKVSKGNSKPELEARVAANIVVYKNEATREDIENKIPLTAKYTDVNGTTHTDIQAYYDWDAAVLSQGGVTEIRVYVIDPVTEKRFYFNSSVMLYVLNKPYISVGIDFAVVEQGNLPKLSAYRPKQVAEDPDYNNFTIKQVTFPISLSTGAVDKNIIGNYPAYISGTFKDFKGDDLPLSVQVKAIVVGKYVDPLEEERKAASSNSNYWEAVKDKLHTGKDGELWLVSYTNYTRKGEKKENSSQTFPRLVNALPGQEFVSMPFGVLEWQYNSRARLTIDLGEINWIFDPGSVKTEIIPRTIGYFDLGYSTKNAAEISSLVSGLNQMQLHFSIGWPWYSEPILKVKVSSALNKSAENGSTLYMFYYNSITDQLELIDAMKNEGDSWFSVILSNAKGAFVITDGLPGKAKRPVSSSSEDAGRPSSPGGTSPLSDGISSDNSGQGASNTLGASDSGENRNSSFSGTPGFIISGNTNTLSEKTYSRIKNSLEENGNTIEQVARVEPKVEGMNTGIKFFDVLPWVLGGIGLAGAVILIILLYKKRRQEENERY